MMQPINEIIVHQNESDNLIPKLASKIDESVHIKAKWNIIWKNLQFIYEIKFSFKLDLRHLLSTFDLNPDQWHPQIFTISMNPLPIKDIETISIYPIQQSIGNKGQVFTNSTGVFSKWICQFPSKELCSTYKNNHMLWTFTSDERIKLISFSIVLDLYRWNGFNKKTIEIGPFYVDLWDKYIYDQLDLF